MEVAGSSETLVQLSQAAWCHLLEDCFRQAFVLSNWRYISVNVNICIMCIAIMINPKCIVGDFAISVLVHVRYLLSDRYCSSCREITSLGSIVCSAATN